MQREPIYAALFSLLSRSAGFQTVGRRLQSWDDTPEQPALFQVQAGEKAEQKIAGGPYRWMLSVRVWIYAKTDGASGTAPSSALNPLVDAVVAAIGQSPTGERQTLGGLVQNAWIDGDIRIYEGVLGQQAIAIIPISILVAN